MVRHRKLVGHNDPMPEHSETTDETYLKWIIATLTLLVVLNMGLFYHMQPYFQEQLQKQKEKIDYCEEKIKNIDSEIQVDKRWTQGRNHGQSALEMGDINIDALREMMLMRKKRETEDTEPYTWLHMTVNSATLDLGDEPQDGDDPIHAIPRCGFVVTDGIGYDCENYTFWDESAESRAVAEFPGSLQSGILTVNKGGLFHVYSQITRYDSLGNAFHDLMLERDGSERYLSKCVGLEHNGHESQTTNRTYTMFSQCHTSRSVVLQRGDILFVRNTNGRGSILKAEPHLTFWGVVLLESFE